MLRSARPDDHAAILALNAESVHFLSPLDAAGLARWEAASVPSVLQRVWAARRSPAVARSRAAARSRVRAARACRVA